jgi:GAF domain-containing protein
MTTEKTSDVLARVADHTSRTYAGADEALEALLVVAQQAVGYRTVLVTHIDVPQCLLQIHAVLNTDPALVVPAGLQIPMTASPCQHVATGVAPLAVADMQAVPDLAVLPAAKDMGARAYLGVPVLLADGTFFGTMAALDTSPQPPSDDHIRWLQLLARLAALEVQRQHVGQLVPAG